MTTIAIDEKTHKEAKIICKTLDLTLGELVQHGVLFFKKTGIDPSKSEGENPLKAIKELSQRVGQVVGFMKEHEQEKLKPLHDELNILSRRLGDSLKILPTSERFEDLRKLIVDHTNLLEDHHAKRMNVLTESRQEIMQENKTELRALTATINRLAETVSRLKEQQYAMQETIDTKLAKKSKLNPFQSA